MLSIEIVKTDYFPVNLQNKKCTVLKNIYFCKQIRLHRKISLNEFHVNAAKREQNRLKVARLTIIL